jgi:hypothetical protein
VCEGPATIEPFAFVVSRHFDILGVILGRYDAERRHLTPTFRPRRAMTEAVNEGSGEERPTRRQRAST